MISAAVLKKLSDIVGPDYCSARPEDLVLYGSDGTNNPIPRPEVVVRPGNSAQVAEVVKLAGIHRIPVVPRGAGSGLTGGAVPVAGGIVVVMTRFSRILEIDQANLIAVVQPGVITAEFQKAVEQVGLFYPPDPASREFSTLGGNAAENAGGTRAVKYGVTRDYILGLEAVLGTGEIIETGVRTAKGVVGYDLTRLLVGSEGTLGIITKLILRLVPRPEAKETISARYGSLEEAAQTVAALTAARIVPATLEFMDRSSLVCVDQYAPFGLGDSTQAMLLIEVDGPAARIRDEAEVVARICSESGALSVRRAEDSAEAEQLWMARRAISPALFRLASGKANEDIVVPRSRIPEMVRRLNRIGKSRQVQIITFGHAGDGNIHVNVMYDLQDPKQAQRAEEAVRDIMAATLELGGTISGEHGIGTTKKAFMSMELRPESLALMARIKFAFDPEGIMNPGKIFPGEGEA